MGQWDYPCIASLSATAMCIYLASILVVACSNNTDVVRELNDAAAGGSAATTTIVDGGGGVGAWDMDGGSGKPACDCPPAAYSIDIEGDGPLKALTFPYEPDLVLNCEPRVPSLSVQSCLEVDPQNIWYSVAGCATDDTSRSCVFVSNDALAPPFESHYLDGSGTRWTLTDVQFQFSDPALLLQSLGQAIEGSFQATGHGDGNQEIALSGSLLVCYVQHHLCPM